VDKETFLKFGTKCFWLIFALLKNWWWQEEIFAAQANTNKVPDKLK